MESRAGHKPDREDEGSVRPAGAERASDVRQFHVKDKGGTGGSDGAVQRALVESLPTAIICTLSARDLASMFHLYPRSVDQQEVASLRRQLAKMLEPILRQPAYGELVADGSCRAELAVSGSADQLSAMLAALVILHPAFKDALSGKRNPSVDAVMKQCREKAPEPCRTIQARIAEMMTDDCRVPHPEGDSTYKEPRRFLQMATEYWRLARQIVLVEMNALCDLLHYPLLRVVVNLRLRLDACLEGIGLLPEAPETKETIDWLLGIIESGIPDDIQGAPDATAKTINQIDGFLEATRLRLGSKTYPLTREESGFMAAVQAAIHQHDTFTSEMNAKTEKALGVMAKERQTQRKQIPLDQFAAAFGAGGVLDARTGEKVVGGGQPGEGTAGSASTGDKASNNKRSWTQHDLDEEIRNYKVKHLYEQILQATKEGREGAKKTAQNLFGRNAIMRALGVKSASMVSKSQPWVAMAKELGLRLARDEVKGTRRTRRQGKVGQEMALEEQGLGEARENDPAARAMRKECEKTLRLIRKLPPKQAKPVLEKYQAGEMTDEQARGTVQELLQKDPQHHGRPG